MTSQRPFSLPPIQIVPLKTEATTPTRAGTSQAIASHPIDLRRLKVEEYFKARSLAPNTQRAYRHELERFLTWTDKTWSDLTPRQVAQFKHHLQEQGLAPPSINRALTAVMSFFNEYCRVIDSCS
jgi:hypothetical protein